MLVTILSIMGLVAVDRVSKLVLEVVLAGKGLIEIIPNIIGVRLLYGGNTGAAFGILEGNTFFLVIMTAIVIFGLIYVLLFKKFKSNFMKCAVILITSGGIGNLYDRIVYGSVTDFFEFLFIDFAVFNVADCYITIGAAFVIVYMFVTRKDDSIFVKAEKGFDIDGK